MKKIAVLTAVFVGIAMFPAQAATKNKLPVWHPVDKLGDVVKLCDGTYLLYKMGGNGSYGKSLVVIPGGCK